MVAEPTQSQLITGGRDAGTQVGGRGSRTITKLVAVLALILATFVPQTALAPAASAAGAQMVSFDKEMTRLVNVKRVEAGLPAVQEATGLTQLSVWWSSQLADGATGYNLEHNPNAFQQVVSYGASSRTSWGENVAKWSPTSVTAAAIFDAYWKSPGHKANILGAAFRYVGMGSVTGANGMSWNTMTFTDKVDAGQVIVPVPNLPGRDNPEGAFQASIRADGTIDVNGWAFDGSNLNANVEVTFTVDGVSSLTVTANGPRPELAAYGIVGNHGLAGSFPAQTLGNNEICMNVRNVGVGADAKVQCVVLNYPSDPVRDNPRGAISASVSTTGTISVNGWGFDPNRLASTVNVMVTVNGAVAGVHAANGPRAELAYYGIPGSHGFAASYAATTTGAQRVCLYVENLGFGVGQWVQCIDLNFVPNAVDVDPRGAFTVSKKNGTITADGWAFDPSNLYAPVTVMLTVNGEVRLFSAAQGPRPELANFGVPGNHGFATASTPGTAGVDSVCLFVFNIGFGTNQLAGCRSV